MTVSEWIEAEDRWERRARIDGRDVVVATLELVGAGWRFRVALAPDGTVRPPARVPVAYGNDAIDACATVLAKLRAAGAEVEGFDVPVELIPAPRQRALAEGVEAAW